VIDIGGWTSHVVGATFSLSIALVFDCGAALSPGAASVILWSSIVAPFPAELRAQGRGEYLERGSKRVRFIAALYGDV
jgi:hypothetical protein